MTIGSAFLGAPPNNAKDVAIIIGLQKLSGASTLNPSAGAPLGPHRPKNANNDTRGPAIIAACSVLMALIILVTTARILGKTSSPKGKRMLLTFPFQYEYSTNV